MIRILHVDDNKQDFELIQLNLQHLSDNILIDWTSSGEQALEDLKKGDYDCVLSDFQMPGIDGLELLDRLRKQNNQIPFIFLTGQGNENLAATAFRSGAADYFSKQIGFAHYNCLLNSIRRNVELSKQRNKQHESEQALRESEERYRALIENSAEGIYRVAYRDPFQVDLPVEEQARLSFFSGFIEECNDALAKMYGFDRAEQLLGHNVASLHGDPIHPKSMDTALKFIESNYRITDSETVELDKDGNKRYFLNNVIGIVKNDMLVGNWGTQRDITEKKKAEQAQKRSVKLFRRLIEDSNVAIVVDDIDGNFEYYNNSFASLFGYTNAEIKKQSIQTLAHPDDVELISRYHNERINGGIPPSRYEIRGVKNGGSIFHLEANAVPMIKGDRIIGTLSYLYDVTDSRQIGESLRLSVKQCESSMAAGGVGIWNWNLETNEVYIGSALKILLGYKNHEIQNLLKGWNTLIYPNDLSNFINNVKACTDGVNSYFEIEHRMLNKDGKSQRFLTRGKFFPGHYDQPDRIVGTSINKILSKQVTKVE